MLEEGDCDGILQFTSNLILPLWIFPRMAAIRLNITYKVDSMLKTNNISIFKGNSGRKFESKASCDGFALTNSVTISPYRNSARTTSVFHLPLALLTFVLLR